MRESIVGGVVAAGLWTLVVIAFWFSRRLWRYGRLRGDFQARRKATDRVEWTLTLRVRGRMVRVSGRRENGATFKGKILMSDGLSNSGRGHYQRADRPDAFGFWEVQVVDRRTILVHETWAEPRRRVSIVDGYVWERF